MNVIIVGGGKVGSYLAALLVAEQYTVKIIELRLEHIEQLRSQFPIEVLVSGSGTNPTVLEKAGIQGTQVVAAVTGADETNLVVMNLARFEFGIPRTIARVNNPKNAWMFTPEMGVDVMLNQADLMAHLIAEEMSLGDMMTLLKLRRGQYSLVEEKVHPTSAAAGKAIRDLNLPKECVITAVIRKGDLIIPRGDLILQAADELLILIHVAEVAQVAALLGNYS